MVKCNIVMKSDQESDTESVKTKILYLTGMGG